MIAYLTDLKVGDFVHTLGDAHIYENHFKQVEEQLSRTPRNLPTLSFIDRNINSIDDFKYEDFIISNYDPYPSIKADIAV
jgi:thymidylate synthase